MIKNNVENVKYSNAVSNASYIPRSSSNEYYRRYPFDLEHHDPLNNVARGDSSLEYNARMTDTVKTYNSGYVMNGTSSTMRIDGVSLVASNPTTYFFSVCSTQTGFTHYLFHSNDGPIILAWNTSTENQLGLYDGAFRSVAPAPADGEWHTITFSLDGIGIFKVYVDGVQVGIDTVYVPRLIGGTTRLFSHRNGIGGLYEGLAGEVCMYARLLDDNQILEEHHRLMHNIYKQ